VTGNLENFWNRASVVCAVLISFFPIFFSIKKGVLGGVLFGEQLFHLLYALKKDFSSLFHLSFCKLD